METSEEIFKKIDFKRLFRSFNKGKKRKLTTKEKTRFKFLLFQCLPLTTGDLKPLQDALSMGPKYGPNKLAKGKILRIEPLDTVMKMVTYDDTHIKLHKLLPGKKIRRKRDKERRKSSK